VVAFSRPFQTPKTTFDGATAKLPHPLLFSEPPFGSKPSRPSIFSANRPAVLRLCFGWGGVSHIYSLRTCSLLLRLLLIHFASSHPDPVRKFFCPSGFFLLRGLTRRFPHWTHTSTLSAIESKLSPLTNSVLFTTSSGSFSLPLLPPPGDDSSFTPNRF